uniref:Major facilitator superfamily associated domain-containing protein n=1 Tax=Lutzomyia longipalpis TaxID=7200 RepID=A0A1B0CQH6_LUTLO
MTSQSSRASWGAVFEGVGVSMGSLIAGISFDKIGGSLTFRWFGLGALVLLVVHVVVRRLHERYTMKFELMQNEYRTPTDAIHMLDDDTQPNSSFA